MNLNSEERLKIRIARTNPEVTDLPLPAYATAGSSGMDIRAAVGMNVVLNPGDTMMIPTGFYIEVPRGFEAQVRPRSGLAIKHGIGILNTPGTIDSDYRGEVKIIVTNFGRKEFVIQRGDRIAQLVIAPVVKAELEEVRSLGTTDRGTGGFGHTGT